MTSTLGFALLGLLTRRRLTGYALSERLRKPIGYFWTARHSQVYPELSRLEAAGLVEHAVIDGPGPRPTKEYAITDAGRAALRDWVTSPLPDAPGRSEFLLRVYCIALVDLAAARNLVARHRQDRLTRLAEYERQADEFAGRPSPGDQAFGAYATLRAGLGYERYVIDYCDWLLAELDQPRRGSLD